MASFEDQLKAAREWLSARVESDMSDLDQYQTISAMQGFYPGGWDLFRLHQKDLDWYERQTSTDSEEPAKVEIPDAELTVHQVLRKISDTVGQRFRLGMLDEILSWEITSDQVTVNVQVYEIVESVSRFRATKRGLRYVTWKKTGNLWDRQEPFGILWDEDFEPFSVVSGFVQTEDVWKDRVWQWDTCYRPGTSKNPMKGPEAREGNEQYYDAYDRKTAINFGRED